MSDELVTLRKEGIRITDREIRIRDKPIKTGEVLGAIYRWVEGWRSLLSCLIMVGALGFIVGLLVIMGTSRDPRQDPAAAAEGRFFMNVICFGGLAMVVGGIALYFRYPSHFRLFVYTRNGKVHETTIGKKKEDAAAVIRAIGRALVHDEKGEKTIESDARYQLTESLSLFRDRSGCGKKR